MRIDVLPLFPEMFPGVLGASILKRAADPAVTPRPVRYFVHDIRAHTTDKHQKVDKPSFGGGPGMVIQCQPVWDTVQAVAAQDAETPPLLIHMTPQGQRLSQPLVEELAQKPRLMILAGHYEGIDQRVIDKLAPLEISIGDYVLSGGEIAAMVLIDVVVRLLPGVLGDAESVEHESFAAAHEGLLDYPHYTRPQTWMGMEVPPVLLSGNHAEIAAWRRAESLRRTAERRPDLLPPAEKP